MSDFWHEGVPLEWLDAALDINGPHAALCDPAWMRALRDLCIANGVAFLLKQWGTWASNPTPHHLELADPKRTKGGATLDGRLWREFPMMTRRSDD